MGVFFHSVAKSVTVIFNFRFTDPQHLPHRHTLSSHAIAESEKLFTSFR